MKQLHFYFLILVLYVIFPFNYGAKILAIFQLPTKSHHILGSALVKGLSDRGHEVTFMSPFKSKDKDSKIENIMIEGLFEIMEEYKEGLRTVYNASLIETYRKLSGLTEKIGKATIYSNAIQKLLTSERTYDLVILEAMTNEAIFGIADHFKAPFAVLSTIGSAISNHLNGNIAPFSFVPQINGILKDKMTFTERFTNAAIGLTFALIMNFKMLPDQESLYKEAFKNGTDFYKLYKNVSLILVNSHVCLETPRPYLPNMIPVGGYHITEPKKLPKDLQDFIDSAKEGVIYFSFGSNLHSADIPQEKLDKIVNTFKNLPQKILWKYEKDNLPNKPNNVLIRKWFPQNDILAHPNVKLFISHGGMLSSTEALFRGVPIIGIPFYGDQKQNTMNFVVGGYGLEVEFEKLSEDYFTNSINEILYNPIYAENAKKKSSIIQDQPMKPLDNAIFWLEHIIRHKGGHHLRSASVDLTYVQYLLLDVITFVSFIVGTLLTGLILTCKVVFLKCKETYEKNKVD